MRRNDTQYSNFWLGDEKFDFNPKEDFDAWDTESLIKLASFKRAVAGFVRIVTGKPIPVVFNAGEQSFTQGSVVVISAKLEHNQIDTAVGVACHEGTHVAITDFQLHPFMPVYEKVIAKFASAGATAINVDVLERELLLASPGLRSDRDLQYIRAYLCGLDHKLAIQVWNKIHKYILDANHIASDTDTSLLMQKGWKLFENFIEDRRIDYYQFKNSPGYVGYYRAMYDAYFYTKKVGNAVRAKNFRRTETWESYRFRIINLLHPDRDLDALKGLREIWTLLDLNNISRLTSTGDSYKLALEFLDVVYSYITAPKPKPEPKQKPSKKQNKKSEKSDKDSEEEGSDSANGQSDDGEEGEEGDSESKPSKKSKGGKGKPDDEKYEDEIGDDEPSDEDDDDEDGDEEGDGEPENDNKTGDANLDLPDGEGSPFSNNDIKQPDKKDDKKEEEKDGDDSSSDSDESSSSAGIDGDDSSDASDKKGKSSGTDEDEDKGSTLSSSQKKQMEKEEEKQSDFLDGKMDKGKGMSKAMADAIKAVEESGVSLEGVGEGIKGNNGVPVKIQCVVIRKLTKELIDSKTFAELFYGDYEKNEMVKTQQAVDDGFRYGLMLGKKLQLRNEARTTKFSRLETGRIDKKLLASLGFENSHVFYRTMTDHYNPMLLEISVDMSGSMNGPKWLKTLKLVTAIAKAASMTTSLHVRISFRGSTFGTVKNTVASYRRTRRSLGSAQVKQTLGYSIDTRPCVLIAYDSRIDKLSKIMQLFKYINCMHSVTPEGLAFEATMDEMVASRKGEIDSIFLNISDGQPYFRATYWTPEGGTETFDYQGEVGAEHTARMVNKMRQLGIEVLAYIIADDGQRLSWGEDNSWEIFKKCYGRDARKINVESITELARTLNEKFLEKGNGN